jgi:hypothetical protein
LRSQISLSGKKKKKEEEEEEGKEKSFMNLAISNFTIKKIIIIIIIK